MRFWDSSAIIPLLVLEQETGQCVKAFQSDSLVMVWTMSRVEVFSALCRRFRERALQEEGFAAARKRMNDFFDRAYEIVSLQKVKDRALRLLQVHPLRALDALQLAAALVATLEEPKKLSIMSFDKRLNDAAKREGFIVNPD